MLERLARAGMDAARLNFSHGDHESHGQIISAIRAVEAKIGRPIGIIQDLAGPKLRIGEVPGGEMELRPHQEIVLSAAEPPRPTHIGLPLPAAPEVLSRGQRVLIGDGAIELVVAETAGTEVRCRVRVGGIVRSHQGIHLPDVALPIEAVTAKDLDDLRFGLEHGVDWVAMSFVRNARDVEPLRREIDAAPTRPYLMAKIEQHEAIEHLREIIDAVDGVMVARGDLGIELPLDRVPVLQKEIIKSCNAAGKPVVTATQMLESMVGNPRPTRAEVSDVANAVLDGTDVVMLSGETAIGSYPVEAVRVMARVATRAESVFNYAERLAESMQWPTRTVTDAISQATAGIARDLGARAIITATASGHTAFMAAKHRPEQPIVAVTPDMAIRRRLTLAWGVRSVLAERGQNTDEMMVNAIARTRETGLLRQGDVVIVTAGVPAGVPGHTNLIKVEVVGEHRHFEEELTCRSGRDHGEDDQG
jgi:pyruvate kinase